MTDESKFLTVKQVAERLQAHPGTVYRWIKQGRLRVARVGGSIRIPESSLDSLTKEANAPTNP